MSSVWSLRGPRALRSLAKARKRLNWKRLTRGVSSSVNNPRAFVLILDPVGDITKINSVRTCRGHRIAHTLRGSFQASRVHCLKRGETFPTSPSCQGRWVRVISIFFRCCFTVIQVVLFFFYTKCAWQILEERWVMGRDCLSVCRRGLERTEGFWVGGGWKPVSGFAPDRVIWESPSVRGMRFSSVWAVSFALLVVSWALSSFHGQSVRIPCEFHIWTRKQVHFSWAKPDTRCWDNQILFWWGRRDSFKTKMHINNTNTLRSHFILVVFCVFTSKTSTMYLLCYRTM